MNLKPEFSDHRVCAKCNAPAMRLGDYAERTVGGKEQRTFFPAAVNAKHRATATHLCCSDYNDHPADPYPCGVVPITMTKVVPESEMPEWCFDSESTHVLPELAQMFAAPEVPNVHPF
jgi:hypothetical protein